MCPRDKQNASTTSLRKKRVTFVEPCKTSTHNTPAQVEHQKINSTNVPGIPSTGVKGASAASRSKPRSNTKKDRTLPAKSALKQVEAHHIMADVNAPVEQAPVVAPPTRTDEQIMPRIRWVPIGKSNSIYIQQFWDTICYDRTDGGYKCQLDEQWFKDTLRDALQIMPVNNNKAFTSPPTQDTLINFVNGLGYPKQVKHLSNVVTNNMFHSWKALTTIINLCLTGKTSGFERPRAPVLQ
ncbi:hypothetical protein Tco_1453265, partial [Tanacetum coccineum]